MGTCIYSNNSDSCQDDLDPCTIDICSEGSCTHIQNCSQVIGDPHFTGLDGSKFDFNGVAGYTYALISSPGLQYNIQLKHSEAFTYIGTVGVRIGNDSLIYTHEDQLFYNNETIATEIHWRTFPTAWGKFHKVKDHFLLETKNWKIKAGTALDTTNGFAFINIWSISFLGFIDSTHHGLIGQTIGPRTPAQDCHLYLENGGCKIEGYADDYLVRSGILGIDFAFSRFDRVANVPSVRRVLLGDERSAMSGSVILRGRPVV